MSTIIIEKYNEVYVRIFSDSSIEQELSDFFKFRVPGYKYMPLYKNKLWDGFTRLYNIHTKTLYVGIVDYVYQFAQRNGYTVELKNSVHIDNGYTTDQIKNFADSLNLHARGEPVEIYDYQVNAVHNALNKNRALIISPTSSGKSLIIYTIVRWHLENNRKCIIILPSTQLVEQLYSDFTDYSSNNGFSVDDNCQKLYSGFSKQFTKNVLLTTWQSVFRLQKDYFNQFDCVIVDEAHQAKSKSLISILEKMPNVKYRIGATGTLDGSQTHKLTLEGLFGKEYKVISTKELMDDGKVADLRISCLLLKYSKESRELLKKAEYKNEIAWLISNPARNKFIRNLAISTNGNTLVLFQFVEKHGKVLYDLIKAKVKNDRKVFFIHGGVDASDREEIRTILKQHSNAILIASYGTLSQGVSIPSIENVIFASPYKSKIKVLQSIGRGLRLNEGKSHCKLFDIADDLSHKSYKNHTLNHALERFKLYTAEQFKMKLIEVDLHGT